MWYKKDYLNRKKEVIEHFKKNGVTASNISEYSPQSGIPITVVCEFLIEEMPEHTSLCQDKMTEIKIFYGIK